MADGQSKGRKFGRSKRGGSMATYNNSRRDLINQKKRVAKHAKAVAKAAAKKATMTPHGTARKLRRGNNV